MVNMECLAWLAGGTGWWGKAQPRIAFQWLTASTRMVASEKYNLEENTCNKLCAAEPKVTFT